MHPRAPRLASATAVVLAGAAVLAGPPSTALAAVRDATPPTAELQVVEVASPQYQSTRGNRLHYNPKVAGSFQLTLDARDPESGVASVTFPALWGAKPWTDTAAPFTREYAWTAAAAAPGTVTAVVTNRAGLRTNVSLSVLADATPPAPGASTTHAVGRTTSTSTSVSFAAGPGDSGAGIARRLLQRRVGTVSNGTCTETGTENLVVNPSASPIVDSGLRRGSCYRYRLTEQDAAGNARVTVGPGQLVINTVPTAASRAVATLAGTAVAVPLRGADADGDTLSYTVVEGPRHGRISGTAPALTYTPNDGYTGADTLRFTVSDGLSASAVATVSLSVEQRNRPPVATAASVSTAEDSAVAIGLRGTDADGDRLTYEVTAGPGHGRLSGTAPALTYTPDTDYTGPDELAFRVSDGQSTSAPATVSLTVTPVNDAPRASAQAITTRQDTAKAVTLTGSDVDGDALTYRVVSPPANGTLSGTAPAMTYTPRRGFSGSDSFAFAANDGTLSSAPATVSVTVEAAPVVPATGPMAFSASGMHGAGFQNVVAVDPRGTGLVLAGADVSGIHRSTDWGKTFTTANTGMTSSNHLRITTLEFSPTVPGKIYAGVGYKGKGGGLLVSTDEGRSWTLRSPVPIFNGDNNDAGGVLPATHPRSTGNLLAFDPAAGLIFAATFDKGVMRSADDGRTWTTLGLAGKYLRSLAIDPADPDVLYASTYGDGVYKTTTGRTTGTFSKLAAAPTHVEELLVLDGKVYAAAGKAGVHSSADAGATWRQLGAGTVRTDGPTWISIDGYRDPVTGKHVVVVGADKATRTPTGMSDSLLRTADGGLTWTSLTADASRIHDEVGGPGGEPWWLLQRQSSMALGRGAYTAAHVVISESTPSRIFVAGRSGIWATPDAGGNWYPMVRGLQVTINRAVVADPNVPGRVYVANTDWILLHSSDGMKTVAQNRPPSGAAAFDLALDTATSPSTLYVATGARDTNSDGEIYSNANPAGGGTWVNEGLRAAVGGKRAVGLAVRRVGGSPVTIAAVAGGGVWRKAGGAWTQVSTAAMGADSEDSKAASLSWVPDSSVVYLYDPTSGVWRSNDDGRTWTRIWDRRSGGWMTGYVAADPTDPSRVYVSVGSDGVYLIEGADKAVVGAGLTPVKVGDVAAPGPIAVDQRGALYVAAQQARGDAAQLRVSADRGATWTTVSDGAYRATAAYPFSVAVGPEGNVYLSLNGNGVLRGQRSS